MLVLMLLASGAGLARPTISAAQSSCTGAVAFPEAIRLPSPGTSPRWLGVWEGQWSSGTSIRLVIERLGPTSALVVYAWSAAADGSAPAGWVRRLAEVSPDGSIGWGGTEERYSYRLGPDVQTLEHTFSQNGREATLPLHRCNVDGVVEVPALMAPPSVGEIVMQDALAGPGVMQASECPGGQSATSFSQGGYVLRTTGRCQSGPPSAFASSGDVSGLTVPDGEIRFQARMLAGRDRLRFRLAVRSDPGAAGSRAYIVRLDPQRGAADLLSASSDQPSTLDERADLQRQLSTTDWLTVAVRMQGPDIWILLNDEPILNGHDSTIATGGLLFTALRLGDATDASEVAMALRNLTVSRLTGGVLARQPVYTGPGGGAAPASASTATGPAAPIYSPPPASSTERPASSASVAGPPPMTAEDPSDTGSGPQPCRGGEPTVFEQSGEARTSTAFCGGLSTH